MLVLSLAESVSTVEGKPAAVNVALSIANEGELVCGDFRVSFSSVDVTASKL